MSTGLQGLIHASAFLDVRALVDLCGEMTMYDTTSTLMNENGDETTTQQGVQQIQPTITLQQLISPHGSGQ